jgi:hypothetical protein
MWLFCESCFIYCYAECHSAECQYADCHFATKGIKTNNIITFIHCRSALGAKETTVGYHHQVCLHDKKVAKFNEQLRPNSIRAL